MVDLDTELSILEEKFAELREESIKWKNACGDGHGSQNDRLWWR
jgi:hypothetical protein